MPQNPFALHLRLSSDDPPKAPIDKDFDPNEFAEFDPKEFDVAIDPNKNTPPAMVKPEEKSLLGQLWDKYNAPLTTIPSDVGKGLANKIDPIGAEPDRGFIKPFMAGATEGLGDVVSGLTSPSNILPMMTGFGAAKTGLQSLSNATKGLSGLTSLHGGQEMIRPDASLTERAMGAAELMGGMAGMAHNYAQPKGIPKGTPIPKGWDLKDMKGASMQGEALPESFGPNAFAGPERRVETRIPSEDAVFNDYRERLARGEDVRSPASKKLLEKKSSLDTSRKEAKTVVRNGITYEQTGVNPDTGAPTYKPVKTQGLESPADRQAGIDAIFGDRSKPIGSPKLLHELKGAKPRFNMGNKTYQPEFASDIDKALFIIAQKNLSKSDVHYLKFITDHLGVDEATARQLGSDVKAKLKTHLSDQEPGVVKVPRLHESSGYVKKTINQKVPLRGSNQPPPPPSNTPPVAGGTPPTPPPDIPKTKTGFLANVLNVSKTLKSSMDFSAPLRQGLPLIHKKAWRTSLDDMVKAWGSQGAYDNIMKEIVDDPSGYFKSNIDPVTGKITKSKAEAWGLDLTDIVHKREEAMLSNLMDEKIPLVKRSNRAYIAFLNKLRADSFKSIVDLEKVSNPNILNDDVGMSAIAKFVNNATGRGSLGKLEAAGDVVNGLLFSPRLVSANVQRLYPPNYIYSGTARARKEYLKSMIAQTGAWMTVAGLAKLAKDSGLADVDVSLDSTSSDFGKVRIGKTRMDPSGGLQSYLVAMSRIGQGKFTPAGGKGYDLGSGYGKKTGFDVGVDFGYNKLSPPARFAGELLKASGYKPFNTTDQVVRLFMPMIIEDSIELAKENPSLMWMVVPDSLGMGTQTFDKNNKNTLLGYKEPLAIK